MKNIKCREWRQKWLKEGSNRGFSNEISESFEMFFDELDLSRPHKISTSAEEWIGWILKDKKEAEALHKVVYAMWPLTRKCYTNEEYLASPYLTRLRERSKKAFEVFMAHEKDNKEFLEFIERVKKNQKRTW